MRRAAPSLYENKSPLICSSRWLVTLFAFGVVCGCSVYTNDLLQTTTGITNGGTDNSGAGHGGALAGTSSTSGGNPGTVTPPLGGEGGEGGAPEGSGMAGADTGGTANVAGTAAVAGTSGSESGGTAGSGGSAGSGGGPININLIDDFEDQNITIKAVDGRGGVWYLFDNGTTGTTGPKPLACCSPNTDAPAALGDYSIHITATGFTGDAASVGSGLGVDFRNQRKVYDGSKFTGIRFWAKVGAGKNTKHRVQIADATTDKAGGKCNTAADAPNGTKCDDHFGIPETFTTAWAQYTVNFDKLTQLGWGNSADALDAAALYGLQITAAPKLEVDLWLDQIEFF
jgi:hypothetical protein